MSNKPKAIEHHSRSEDELRAALASLLRADGENRDIAPHYDAAETILGDGIDELLKLRMLVQEMRAFVVPWAARLIAR